MRNRSGAIGVLPLVVLLVVTSLVATMLERALVAQRQLRRECEYRQALLHVASALERARDQLAESAEYRGESLRLAAWDAAGRVPAADVEITVLPRDAGHEVRVAVEVNRAAAPPIHVTETCFVPEPTSPSAE